MLYQRYFLRMNQSSTTHILSLLLALVLSLATIRFSLIPLDSSFNNYRNSHRNHNNNSSSQNDIFNISFNLTDDDLNDSIIMETRFQQTLIENNFNTIVSQMIDTDNSIKSIDKRNDKIRQRVKRIEQDILWKSHQR